MAAVQVVTVWPFPTDELSELLATGGHLLVVEGNTTGQLEGLLREHCLIQPDSHLRRFDGRPISPELVYQKIKAVMGEQIALTACGAVSDDRKDR